MHGVTWTLEYERGKRDQLRLQAHRYLYRPMRKEAPTYIGELCLELSFDVPSCVSCTIMKLEVLEADRRRGNGTGILRQAGDIVYGIQQV